MQPSNDECITEAEQEALAQLSDRCDTANDVATDAQLALARFQRTLAIRYRLRGKDACDRFGQITREPAAP